MATGGNSVGFQGSEHSGVEVKIYRQTGDPLLATSGIGGEDVLTLRGDKASSSEHALISVNTNKTLGPAAGTFSFSLKPSSTADEILKAVNDDDWVDISFLRHGRKWHTMRGLIDDIRRGASVSGTGATSQTYNISGRDFTKIFEKAALYADIYSDVAEAISGVLPQKIFETNVAVADVPTWVKSALEGYLGLDDDQGRTQFIPPKSLPNITDKSFIKSVKFLSDDFSNVPKRILLNSHWLSPGGMLWQWVTERADPMFTDIYTDLLPASNSEFRLHENDLRDGLSVDDSVMSVITRDKPFPLVDLDFIDKSELHTGRDSAWFDLALFEVPRQQIINTDVGRTGHERFNAFFLSPQIFQEIYKGGDPLAAMTPLWSPEEIDRHGLLRFDVQTIWAPDLVEGTTYEQFTGIQRAKVRDWYAINAYLLNGTIALATGRPDLRIGHRMRIPGTNGESNQETYYIEQLSHNWSLGSGTKTSVGVTRGWIGTDNQLLDTMALLRDTYLEPAKAKSAS